MKQRMFCTAVAVMIVLRAAVMLPINIVFTGCCMLCVAAVLLAVFCKKHINIKDYVFVLLACSVALCAYEVNFKINVEPAMQLSGVRAEIVGTVVEEPKQKDGYKVFLVKTESIDKKGAVQKVKLRICANAQEEIKPFDKISASVDFSDVSENYKSSNYANGIYIGSTADDFMRVSSPDKPPVYAKIIELRQYVRNTLKTNIGDRYSGVICGLILGDIDGISDNDYLNFREIGVMHLFSVSGLHLIVVCSVFMAFLRKIRIGKRFSALITLGVVFLVMSITGFSPSVMRSSITYIIMLLGIIFMRLPGNINSLGVAILVILIIKPYYILNLAFIMSCVSIMGIIFLSSPINSFFMRFAPDIAIVRGVYRAFSGIFAASIAAGVALIPISAIYFGGISIISPVANVLIEFPAMLAMVLGVISVLMSAVPFLKLICNFMFFITAFLIKYILICSDMLSHLPIKMVYIGYNWFIMCIAIIFLVLGIFAVIKKAHIRAAAVVVTVCLVISTSVIVNTYASIGKTKVSVIGDGICVLVTKGREAVVIGCAEKDDIVSKVSKQYRIFGINETKAIIVPSKQANCAGGAGKLIQTLNSDDIYIPAEKYGSLEIIDFYDYENIAKPLENLNLQIWENVQIEAITQKYGCYIRLTIDNIEILIATSAVDAKTLDINFIPDIIITGDAVPENITVKAETIAILATDSYKLNKGLGALEKYHIPICNNMPDDVSVVEIKNGKSKILMQKEIKEAT